MSSIKTKAKIIADVRETLEGMDDIDLFNQVAYFHLVSGDEMNDDRLDEEQRENLICLFEEMLEEATNKALLSHYQDITGDDNTELELD